MAEAQALTAQETGELAGIIGEVLDILFDEANAQIAARVGRPDARIPYSDRIKIDLAAKILALSKRHGAQARFTKIVDSSNALVPCLTRLFGAERISGRLPPRARDERVVRLCEKAGATELAALIRGSTAPEILANPPEAFRLPQTGL